MTKIHEMLGALEQSVTEIAGGSAENRAELLKKSFDEAREALQAEMEAVKEHAFLDGRGGAIDKMIADKGLSKAAIPLGQIAQHFTEMDGLVQTIEAIAGDENADLAFGYEDRDEMRKDAGILADTLRPLVEIGAMTIDRLSGVEPEDDKEAEAQANADVEVMAKMADIIGIPLDQIALSTLSDEDLAKAAAVGLGLIKQEQAKGLAKRDKPKEDDAGEAEEKGPVPAPKEGEGEETEGADEAAPVEGDDEAEADDNEEYGADENDPLESIGRFAAAILLMINSIQRASGKTFDNNPAAASPPAPAGVAKADGGRMIGEALAAEMKPIGADLIETLNKSVDQRVGQIGQKVGDVEQTLGKMTDVLSEIGKRLSRIEAQPAAPRGSVRAVAKDADNESALAKADAEQQLKSLPPEKQTEAMIKASFGAPIKIG